MNEHIYKATIVVLTHLATELKSFLNIAQLRPLFVYFVRYPTDKNTLQISFNYTNWKSLGFEHGMVGVDISTELNLLETLSILPKILFHQRILQSILLNLFFQKCLVFWFLQFLMLIR